MHLNSSEINLWVGLPADSAAEPCRGRPEIQQHIDQCLACRDLVDRHAAAQRKLTALRVADSERPEGTCPDGEVWDRVAAGLLDERERETALTHAASCGPCSKYLAEAVECLTAPPTPEESEFLDRLPERRTPVRSMPPALRVRPAYFWYGAVAAALLAAAGLFWWMAGNRQPETLRLLAHAYTEHRTMELRVWGAEFAHLAIERGTAIRSPSLLEAEAALAANQPARTSPDWLHARGLACLLEGRFEDAVQLLRRASAAGADSSIQTDLASALAERGLSNSSASDLAEAESILDGVAAGRRDAAAAFNLALIREYRQERAAAQAAWNDYLKLDSKSGWAQEAREHLSRRQQ